MQSIKILHRNKLLALFKYLFYHSRDKTMTTEILNLAQIYKHILTFCLTSYISFVC